MAAGDIIAVGALREAHRFRAVHEPPLQDSHQFRPDFLFLRQFLQTFPYPDLQVCLPRRVTSAEEPDGGVTKETAMFILER